MIRAQHTPGPWATSLDHPTIIKLAPDFLGESNVLIGSASGHPNSGFFPSEEEAVANARLIAASPDLLTIVTDLAKLREGLDNGNSSAEFRVSQLAERAEKLVAALMTGGAA